jgi:uncharacterized lipoprotein NlpE involved in copper resistance
MHVYTEKEAQELADLWGVEIDANSNLYCAEWRINTGLPTPLPFAIDSDKTFTSTPKHVWKMPDENTPYGAFVWCSSGIQILSSCFAGIYDGKIELTDSKPVSKAYLFNPKNPDEQPPIELFGEE